MVKRRENELDPEAIAVITPDGMVAPTGVSTEFVGTIKKVRVGPFDYSGTQDFSVAVQVTYLPDDESGESIFVDHLKIASLDRWVPALKDEGRILHWPENLEQLNELEKEELESRYFGDLLVRNPRFEGKKTKYKLLESTKWSQWVKFCLTAGMPPIVGMKDFRYFEGIKAFWETRDQTVVIKGDDGEPLDLKIFAMAEYYGRQGEKSKKNKKKSRKAKKTEEFPGLDDELKNIVWDLLDETEEGRVLKKSVNRSVIVKIEGNEKVEVGLKRVKGSEFWVLFGDELRIEDKYIIDLRPEDDDDS